MKESELNLNKKPSSSFGKKTRFSDYINNLFSKKGSNDQELSGNKKDIVVDSFNTQEEILSEDDKPKKLKPIRFNYKGPKVPYYDDSAEKAKQKELLKKNFEPSKQTPEEQEKEIQRAREIMSQPKYWEVPDLSSYGEKPTDYDQETLDKIKRIPKRVLAKLPHKITPATLLQQGARLRGRGNINDIEQVHAREMEDEWKRTLDRWNNYIISPEDAAEGWNNLLDTGFFALNPQGNINYYMPKWETVDNSIPHGGDITISCTTKKPITRSSTKLPSGLTRTVKVLGGTSNPRDITWSGTAVTPIELDSILDLAKNPEVIELNKQLIRGRDYKDIYTDFLNKKESSFNSYVGNLINELKEYPSINGISTSDDEDAIYDMLVDKYGKENVIRQYEDEDRYPYECDFYIKPEDMFIEYYKHWTHGRRKYNPDDPSCQEDIKWLEGKAKDNAFYKRALDQWREKDVEKAQCAEDNNLNYLVFYNIREFNNWLENPELTYEEYKDPDPLQYDSDAYFASKAKGQNTNGNDMPKDKQ